jgi:hypothetical protein
MYTKLSRTQAGKVKEMAAVNFAHPAEDAKTKPLTNLIPTADE